MAKRLLGLRISMVDPFGGTRLSGIQTHGQFIKDASCGLQIGAIEPVGELVHPYGL
jgi:hypothetical protein